MTDGVCLRAARMAWGAYLPVIPVLLLETKAMSAIYK